MADIDALSIRISASTKVATRNINNLVTALQSLNTALGNINPSGLNTVTSATSNMTTAMSRASESTRIVAQSITVLGQQAGNMAQVGDSAQNIADRMAQAGHGVREAGEALHEGANGAREVSGACQEASNAAETLRDGFRGLLNNIRTVGSVFKTVAQGALSAAKHIKDFGKSSRSSKSNVAGLVKEITRLGKMLKLMITRMVLRKIISGVLDGFKSLAQYSKTFDATLSLLWNDFRQLGNSIAAAVSPLLNALAPAIHYIIQLVIQAVDAINQLISAIMGLGSFTRAKKLTDSYAGSLGSANKSAKELKKTLLGFDEINQLQDNKSGGGGGTSPADMFEEAPISDKWKDWAKKLKDMWKKGDFTELGKYLGEQLLKALDSIPWAKIKKKARKVGSSLATLINGFVEVPRLGRMIGKTIAEAINTAFEFANEFVHRLHWDSIGKFISETLNGFFENIDWKLIKDTIVTGLAGLAETIQTAIENFNWDNISRTLINALDVVSAGIKSFFEGIDWEDLGEKFGTQLTETLRGTDWQQVGEAIGDVIQAAIGFLAGLIRTFSWSDLISALYDALVGCFKSINKDDLGTVIGEVVRLALIFGIGKMAWATITTTIANSLSGAFLGSEVTTAVEEAGTTAGLTFIGGLTAAFAGGVLAETIIEGFNLKEKWADLSATLAEAWRGSPLNEKEKQQLEDFKEVYSGLGGTFEALKNEGKEVLRFFGVDIPQTTYTLKDEFGNVKKTVDESGKAIIDFTDGSSEAVNDLSISIEKDTSALNTAIKDTQKATEEVTISIEQDWQGAQQEISGAVQTLSLDTSKSMGDIKKSVDDSMKDVNKSFDTVKDGLTENKWTFSGVADGLIKTFEAAKKGIAPIWNSIVDKLNGEHKIGFSSFSINLPRFAAGGFPKTGTMFLANEAGAEMVGSLNGRTAVANNQEITDGIAMAVFNAMTMAQGNGGQYINNTIMVDGDVIARAVTKGQDRMNRRYSPTMA